MRVGFGYDSHRFSDSSKLVLGGVEIPHEKGLLGHSDADVLTHAITDAIIGALGLGDIGGHFPDTDPRWKDARSVELLKSITGLAKKEGYKIEWIDATIITEKPKIAPHIPAIKASLNLYGVPDGKLNIKAKTNEGMGFIGRNEGMAACAACLLIKS